MSETVAIGDGTASHKHVLEPFGPDGSRRYRSAAQRADVVIDHQDVTRPFFVKVPIGRRRGRS